MDVAGSRVLIVSSTGVDGIQEKEHAVAQAEESGCVLVQVGRSTKGADGEPLSSPLSVCRAMTPEEYDVFTGANQPAPDTAEHEPLPAERPKEVRFGHNIAEGDVQTKVRQVLKFLEAGYRVRIAIRFGRRWQFDAELAEAMMENLLERIEEFAAVDEKPMADARAQYACVVAPRPGVAKEDREKVREERRQRRAKVEEMRQKIWEAQEQAEQAALGIDGGHEHDAHSDSGGSGSDSDAAAWERVR